VRAASAGREDAFAAIFRRYQQPLYRYCCSLLRSEADAADALQSTMLAALRSLPGEERSIELKPWLYRIAHNESISLIRRRRPDEELDDRQPAIGGDPAASAEQRADFQQLMADLGELSEAQRSALLMRELSGLSYEEIASAFAISLPAAKQSIHKARTALQQIAEGRQMKCEEIQAILSERDGRLIKGRGVRSHLRSCSPCEDYSTAISRREATLQAVTPALAAPAAAEMLAGVFGGSAQGGGSAGLGALVGGGKLAGSSAALQALAVGAAVVTVGAGGLGLSSALGDGDGNVSGADAGTPRLARAPASAAAIDAGSRTGSRGDAASERAAAARRAVKPPAAQGKSSATSATAGSGPASTSAEQQGSGSEAALPPPAPSTPSAPGAATPAGPQTGAEHSEAHVPESAPVPPLAAQPPVSIPTSPAELPPGAPTGGGVPEAPAELPSDRP